MSKVSVTQHARHEQLLQAFHEHLPVTRKIQRDLLTLLKDLAAEESWSEDVVTGATEWAGDIGVSWRALRRTRFKPDRVPPDLLEALRTRLTRSLHGSVPIIAPYNAPSHRLFTYIPPSVLTDKVSRPVAIITLRLIRRDAKGSLDPLKEWAWWIAEMGRRTIRDWYDVDGTGQGTEHGHQIVTSGHAAGEKSLGGCVVIVDCKGTGLKNLELDFLPYLVNINHNHFPGLFETVYVVNYTWTQSALWTVAKRVLPESALEKIVFLNSKEVGEMFDLERLPRAYGGRSSYDPFVGIDATSQHYARPAAGVAVEPSIGVQDGLTSSVDASFTAGRSIVQMSTHEANPATTACSPNLEIAGSANPSSATAARERQSPEVVAISPTQSNPSDEAEDDTFHDAEDEQDDIPVLDHQPSITDFHRYLSSSRPTGGDIAGPSKGRTGESGQPMGSSLSQTQDQASADQAGQRLGSRSQSSLLTSRDGSVTSSAIATRTSDAVTDSSSLTAPSCAIITPPPSRCGSLVRSRAPSSKCQ